jgi:hypothetical protein
LASTIVIYVTALALCLLSGVVVRALIDPRGPWTVSWCLPLGAGAAMMVLFPIGYLVPARSGAFAFCALLAGALATVIVVRIRSAVEAPRARSTIWAELRAALLPARGDALVLAIGTAGGLIALIPIFSLGFPSTIAATIADGWARAVNVEWLLDHPLSEAGPSSQSSRPLGIYSAVSDSVGAGFEYLTAVVTAILGRQAYEVVGPVAPIAVPIAVCGWVRLWQVASRRRPGSFEVVLVSAAVLGPTFLLPLADNYITQLLSLALWPFAVAASLAFFRRPAATTLVVAAIGVAAVMATYPPLLLWLAPAIVAAAAFSGATPDVEAIRSRVRSARLRRVLVPAGLLATLALTLVVLSPIQFFRAIHSVRAVERLESNPGFPLFEVQDDAALFLGAISQFSLKPFGSSLASGEALLLTVLVAIAAVAGALALARSGGGFRDPLGAVGVAALAVTGAVYVRYKYVDDYGYGAYKSLISGGTLFAGLLVLALAARAGPRLRPAQLVLWGCCVAIWSPVASLLLERQREGELGFREVDREVGRSIERLPRSSVVLVEGVVDTTQGFDLRMTVSYFGLSALERNIEGVGTTASYVTRGGAPDWRPSRPWSHVVSVARPSPFGRERRPIVRNDEFRIAAAPALDVTPYILRQPQKRGEGRDARDIYTVRGGSFQWMPGPFELIVSNRSRRPRTARLQLKLSSHGIARTVVLSAPRATGKRVRIKAGKRPTSASVDLPVAGRSTATVKVDARPGARLYPLVVEKEADFVDERPVLLRVHDARVQDAT